MKRSMAALILMLGGALVWAGEGLVAATDPLGFADLYRSEEACLAAVAKGGDAAILYGAGRHIMAALYGSMAEGGPPKERGARLCKEAASCFEKALQKDKRKAPYGAWSAAARLLSCSYGGVLVAIRNGSQGTSLFRKAVAMAPNDAAIRLLRSRAYVYLPRKYYPDCDETILEDTGFVLAKLAGSDGTSVEAAIPLEEAARYRSIALKQLGRKEEAAALRIRLEDGGRLAALADGWKRR